MKNKNKIMRSYKQELLGSLEKIFPLLCPVREKEWLPGWEYNMIFSESGYAEKGCVFETNNEYGTYHWVMTLHNIDKGEIQFVKTSEKEDVIIDISIEEQHENLSYCNIQYTFIPMSSAAYHSMTEENSDEDFRSHMRKWEETLNYYLIHNEMINES